VARRRAPPPAERLTPELKDALESFEQGALDRVVRRRRPEDYEALRELAASDAADPNLRQRAIQALGRWGDASAVPDIAAFLLSPATKDSHRITAIEALGRLGTKTAREAVEQFTSDPSPQLRKFVVRALSQIGDPAARARLRKISKTDPTPWVRALASDRTSARPAQRRKPPS
jgi:HEAT repeat protein